MFVAVALITLGSQIAYTNISSFSGIVIFSSIYRLIFSPIVSFIEIVLLGVEGTIAQALFISSAFPSSRGASLLSLENNNCPDVASSIIVITTLMNCFSVTFVIF